MTEVGGQGSEKRKCPKTVESDIFSQKMECGRWKEIQHCVSGFAMEL